MVMHRYAICTGSGQLGNAVCDDTTFTLRNDIKMQPGIVRERTICKRERARGGQTCNRPKWKRETYDTKALHP